MEHDLMEFGRKLVFDLLYSKLDSVMEFGRYAPNRFGTSSELAI